MSFTMAYMQKGFRTTSKLWIGGQALLLNIPIIIMMQLGYQLKTAISACIPSQLPANCSSLRQLQQQHDSGDHH